MPYFLSPVGNDQQCDANGNPLVGGKIYTYLAGTNTPAATFMDSSSGTQQANPIILNSLGLPASPIWQSGGIPLKYVIKDSADVLIRTIDNISGVNDSSSTVSEWTDSGFLPTYISGTKFSVQGDQTAIFQVNRRVRTKNTAGYVYGRVTASVYAASITTVTVLNDSGAIDAGISFVAYGFLSFSPSSIPYALYAGAGANTDITSISGIASINGGQLAGFRNKIINGRFAFNQRGVSGTVTRAAGLYGHDRWKAGAGGCTYTFATSGNTTTITITAGTLMQVIEGANLDSGSHTLSWTGTAQGRVDSGSYGASGVVGTAVAGTNQTVEFGTGTLTNVQYEYGTTATAFETRQYGIEDYLCKRYYEKVGGNVSGEIVCVAGLPSAGYYATIIVPYVAKRVAPTVSVIGTWTVNQMSQPSLAGVAGLSYVALQASASAGGGQNYFQSTASSGLLVDAEL